MNTTNCKLEHRWKSLRFCNFESCTESTLRSVKINKYIFKCKLTETKHVMFLLQKVTYNLVLPSDNTFGLELLKFLKF